MAQKLPNRKYSVLPGTQDLSLSEYLMDFLYSSMHDIMLEATENLKELTILNICTRPSWSTIHLSLTMMISNVWNTKKLDYTNAFYQAYFK